MHNLKKRSPEVPKRKESGDKLWWQPGLILFGRLSGWIIGPVILAVIVGKWLDNKYGTAPWLFLVTVGLSFVISMYGLVREGMQAIREAERWGKGSNKGTKSKGDQPEWDERDEEE